MKIIDTITTKAGHVYDIVRGEPDRRLCAIPIRKGRRKTTLPSPTPPRTAATFSEALKQAWIGPMLHELNPGPLWAALAPDPWDEAIKWIEQRKATDAEWPWPKR